MFFSSRRGLLMPRSVARRRGARAARSRYLPRSKSWAADVRAWLVSRRAFGAPQPAGFDQRGFNQRGRVGARAVGGDAEEARPHRAGPLREVLVGCRDLAAADAEL